MFWRVNITGEWHGRFEYDDPAAAPYAESFVWQITHERSGRVSGDCTDSVTGQRAELLGRIDRRQLEILKQYPTDPSVLLGTDAGGRHVTIAELYDDAEWRQAIKDFNAAQRRNRQPALDTVQLIEEYAEGLSRIIYTGRVVRRTRMEGQWVIPAFKFGLGCMSSPEVRGTWWAERK